MAANSTKSVKCNKRGIERLFENGFLEWEMRYGFQHSVVENAAQRFKTRAIGWLMHRDAWRDDIDEKKFTEEWEALEKKHTKGYTRWKKLLKLKGGFDRKSKDQDFEKRFGKVFLFYLVYGEIHDFRNMKNVLNLFYHFAYERWEAKEPVADNMKVAEWVRFQGQNLYKILALTYSNTEMNQVCFNHDDLDDLCNSTKFVKDRFVKRGKDFLEAFGVGKNKPKFPYMAKLIEEDKSKFIKFWLRSIQSTLTETDRTEREEWTRQHLLDKNVKNSEQEKLKGFEKDLERVKQELAAAKIERDQMENERSSDRPVHPLESDFHEEKDLFSASWLNFETSKEMFSLAEKHFNDAQGKLNEARSVAFRNREQAITAFSEAEKKFELAHNLFSDCAKGFLHAADTFRGLQSQELLKYQISEAEVHVTRAKWYTLASRECSLKTSISRFLQFRFEDALDEERARFAKKFKTFFEKAGGSVGLSGYITILQHYSTVVYLHLILLIPVILLYFGWDVINELIENASDVAYLVSLESPIPFAALSIVLIVLFTIFLFLTRFRTSGFSAPRRDAGTRTHWFMRARFISLLLWILVLATELVGLKYLVIDPIKEATESFLEPFDYIKSPILLLAHWVPVIVLFLSSLQFVFTLWVGIFGWAYGIIDKVAHVKSWKDVQRAFDENYGVEGLPHVVNAFNKTMMPELEKQVAKQEATKFSQEEQRMRKRIAFARVWNEIIKGFFDIHKISKEELQNYSYNIKNGDPRDFLSGIIEKHPNLAKQPQVAEVRYHLAKFVNNVMMDKPTNNISVRRMLPLTVVTPVGAEKILYPYEYITHVDNTQHSFLQHLIQKEPVEWANFVRKEGISPKAVDFLNRLEKDIMQGLQPDQNKKRWIHNHRDGIELKLKICEWASLRFQALYRTIHGFMQAPKALALLARVQEPWITQAEAEELVRQKFTYLVGYQTFGQYYRIYKATKDKAEKGTELTKREMEAHDAVFNIKFIKNKFPGVRIAYPDYEDGKYVGKLSSGNDNGNFYDYTIELFGPFSDMGLGKPTHQNYLSQFIDGLAIQTIDVNQDNVISQSFFIPNVLSEFSLDKTVKIVGCPEFVITQDWSSTAWCSAFSERTFGTLVQRMYARMHIRLHYGHPDYLDALWIMTETGLSKMPYVSEDIFTGFDTVIKGGKIIHVEYHEVGKARDVDLYTTTKFIRKISMGASQMACTRYIKQLQTSSNVSYLQRLSFYYSTVGFYLNHLMLYVSVWFALVGQLLLVIMQKYIFEDEVSDFMVNRVFSFQIGMALVAPGVLQLILEKGLLVGIWTYISRFLILAVYSTFHILNTASYWQWGLVRTAFYLASGRGSGLEHYFMKDMYETFYSTHWRAGFIILWLGIFQLILSGNILVFLIMFLLPSAIWIWGAMFLNPGALPSTVHEEQWKRLINRDMKETKEIIKQHTKVDQFRQVPKGNAIKRLWARMLISMENSARWMHWVYSVINFNVQMRVVRLIGLFVIAYEMVLAKTIPTYIFTDDRRRVLRWDEEETRQKSIFYSNMANKPDSPDNLPNNGEERISFHKKKKSLSGRSASPEPQITRSGRRLVFADQAKNSSPLVVEKRSVDPQTHHTEVLPPVLKTEKKSSRSLLNTDKHSSTQLRERKSSKSSDLSGKEHSAKSESKSVSKPKKQLPLPPSTSDQSSRAPVPPPKPKKELPKPPSAKGSDKSSKI